MIKVCTDYEIPYVGGYSEDEKTIYICRNYPRAFRDLSGKVHFTHEPLRVHEECEAELIGLCGFERAHRHAVEVELSALISLNIPIDEYYGFLYKHVRKNLRKIKEGYAFDLPPDLNMEPYISDNLRIIRK